MTEARRQSRYNRPRRSISWFGLIFGIALGIGGGIYFAWQVSPTEEFDTAPWQLTRQDRAHYMVAVMVNYAYDGNLTRTINQLLELRPEGDPIQHIADVACDLARSGYVNSNSGLNAVRSMMTFYQGQGKVGCADNLIPAVTLQPTSPVIIAASPTPLPQPSKTPLPEIEISPTPTTQTVIEPTEQLQRDFFIAGVQSFCDIQFSGIIEVYVQNAPAGQAVRVRWADGESTFFTGLKPERGQEYADFQMEANKNYIIEMPGRSDPSDSNLIANSCNTTDGQTAITSYRVFFRPSF